MSYENELIVKIAWKYYNEGLTQNEIAEALNLSRMKVIKYLDIAKSNNIIQFKINLDPLVEMDLQKKILKKYKLKDIYIIPASDKNLIDSLTKAAAQYIEDRITSDTMINVGYGNAVSKTLGQLNVPSKYKVTFVSLAGGVKFYMPTDNHRTTDFYSNLNFNSYIIPSPLIVSTPELAQQLLNENSVKKILEMIPHSNITLIGIGALNERATMVKEGYLNTNEIEIMKSKGAVGDILSQFFDIKGRVLEFNLHKKLISVDIHTLKTLNHVVAVAGGLDKKEAIIGALNGGFIDVLITDELVAKHLI